jgi:hypothetical protein
MVGRPKKYITPEQIKEKKRLHRLKYKSYIAKYNKYYYLKRLLADPNYNQKKNLKTKLKKSLNQPVLPNNNPSL